MIPGFEDGLLGNAGDERTLSLTFPTDYHAEDLAGAEVEFGQVSDVQALELAPVDEALFAQYGLEDGVRGSFRAEVKQNMEVNCARTRGSVENQVMDAVVAAHDDLELRTHHCSRGRGNASADVSAIWRSATRHGPDHNPPDEMFSEQAERRSVPD